MSGFFGILRLDASPVDQRLLEKISERMSFRGPDGVNVWNQGPIGGCFSLMRTGPVKQAPCQPVSWDNRFLLWGSLRVDGRQDLLEKLAPEVPRALTDVTSEELLVRSWVKWGPASLEKVMGDFSFALWDAPEQVFWCARDFVGARPFYYAHVRGVFCFSNTLQILRLVPEVSGELDEFFLGDFLLDGWNSDASRTVYKDIRRLRAGHLLKLANGNPEIRRFRKLPIEKPLQLDRPEEYLEIYRDLLKTAVSDRLPQGAASLYLSGGLDSASVCATASQIVAWQKQRLKAFTIGWTPFLPDQEPALARVTAQHLGIAHEVLEVRELRPFESPETGNSRPPEPNDEVFFPLHRRICRRIAEHSSIVLAGDGGDDVLTGQSWPYLTGLWQQKKWKRIARDFGGYLWTQKNIPPLRGGFRTSILRAFRRKDPFVAYPEWLNPDFEARMKLRQRWLALRQPSKNPEHPFHPEAYEALHSGYWASVLETEDAGWNGVPLESRAPLLDLRLLSFLLRLPPVPWCMNKFLCRRAMKPFLPEEILNRRKTPLSRDPLETCDKRGDWVLALLNSPPHCAAAFINWSKWCETLYHFKGSLTFGILRPVSLFYWLKAVESK